jgi:uncharacterized protein DUF4440/uncharacterized protein DUF3471
MRVRGFVGFAVAMVVLASALVAQNEKDDLSATILIQDGMFWNAYNQCDVEKMSQFFWPDVEFYHDKGGPTLGLSALTASLRNNLCGRPDFRLRREALPSTIHVYPLQKDGVTYGAVLSGEHYFYINEKGKAEYRDGLAKFFHVWLLKDGTWKMARVVSYDHGPAPYETTKKAVTVSADVLAQYVGTYIAPQSGTLVVTTGDNSLSLTIGEKQYLLHPESQSVFFTSDRDLTFEFVKEGPKVSKVVVREHGAVVEEAKAK